MLIPTTLLAAAFAAAAWQPPAELDGWKPAEPVQRITPDTLFAYMDGAGELYLAYAFRSVGVWTLKQPGEARILIEVYDLTRPEEAFGVLSQDLGGADVKIGDRCAYGAGLLRFCKGRYFVRVLADVETERSKRAVLALGSAFAKTVTEKPALPAIVRRLPKDGLKPNTVHYFHTKLLLDYLYYVADENILHLSAKTDAVLADYAAGKGKVRLLIVDYPGEAAAKQAWASFHKTYLEQEPPEAGKLVSRKLEDGKWCSIGLKGKTLAVTFEAPTMDASEQALRAGLASSNAKP